MNNSRSNIKLRRSQVTSLLSQFLSEGEIAQRLGVDQTTVNRDIKQLKSVAQKFIFDLAKQDLGFYYTKSIKGIEEIGKRA